MKNLYAKNKGRIHPSPSASSSWSSTSSVFYVRRILNLLPAAILALASALMLEDQEVLAYLIVRSTKPPSLILQEKKKCKKPNHSKPLLDCGCFDCYMSFWTRWNSSPNRDLIHQVIEAFEDHLAKDEQPKKKNSAVKNRKKERRFSADRSKPMQEPETELPPEIKITAVASTVMETEVKEKESGEGNETVTENRGQPVGPLQRLQVCNNRGLVRKVWPDVLGLFNSRLWSLWNPNA